MDWNNDGRKDLIAGDGAGQIWIFINIGTDDAPVLAKGQRLKVNGKILHGTFHSKQDPSHDWAKDHARIHFADWDGDGLKDFLIGYDGDISFLKNEGTAAEPMFKQQEKLTMPAGSRMFMAGPVIEDWNNDGLQDLVIGNMMGVYYFPNIGTATAPKLGPQQEIIPKPEKGQLQWGQARLHILDWNDDGKRDIVLGNTIFGDTQYGTIMVFLRN